jgi:hypothetical protein
MVNGRRNSVVLAIVFGAAILTGNERANAQLPQHRLFSVYPAGGQAGETVQVQLTGTQLDGPLRLWFDHPGLRAFQIKGATFRVAIAPGTPVGYHDVRVLGPHGSSNPRTFVVGDRPESVEKEPNNSPETANPIVLNSTVNGRMDGSPDVDCFALACKAHERFLIELEGEQIESRIMGVLALLDPTGRVIAESHDGVGADPVLEVEVPSDGRYVIKVRDAVYNGSPDFAYRLSVHDGPRIEGATPVVVQSGDSHEVTLVGRNLGGDPVSETASNRAPLEERTVTVTTPGIGGESAADWAGYLPAPWAVRRGFEYRIEHLGRRSNPVFFAAALDPVSIDTEPNDDTAHAQEIALPREVSGTFGKPGDRDCFRFTAKKGQVWIIDVMAERMGSAADPVFAVQQIPQKGEPREVLANDDVPDPAPGQPFSPASVDALARWQVPEDGSYQIVLNDLYGSQRGDFRLFYRLNIRPERPDYCVFVLPAGIVGGAGLTGRVGGRAVALLTAQRLDGFNGPIEVDVSGLPDGVTTERTVIGPGQTHGALIFNIAPWAAPFDGAIRIVAHSISGDRKEVLDFVPGKSRVAPEIQRSGLGANLVWDPQNSPTAASRISRGVVLSVREGPSFRLTASPTNWVLGRGESFELNVHVDRRSGLSDAIQVATTTMPPNMGGGSTAIPKDQTWAALKLTVPQNTPPGNYTFHLSGTGAVPFSLDPNAKPKPKINIVEPSNSISLTVRR